MDELLAIRLAAQDGVASAADLHDAGVCESSVRTAVRHGDLIRVRRGAYVLGALFRKAHPDRRYRLKVAAVLRTRPHDAASHHAALAVHDLPLFGCDLRRIDTVGTVAKTIARSGLVVHPVGGSQMAALDGVRAVAVADAIVQTTCTTGIRSGVVAADAAVRMRRCALESVSEAADRLGVRDAPRLTRLLGLVDPLAESPGESLTRVLLRTTGLRVRSQVRISDAHGRVARVDFLVGEKVVVEFDGEVKYTGNDPNALFLEKQREDWLRELGYEVVRVVWSDLADPRRLVARVRAAMTRAARRAS